MLKLQTPIFLTRPAWTEQWTVVFTYYLFEIFDKCIYEIWTFFWLTQYSTIYLSDSTYSCFICLHTYIKVYVRLKWTVFLVVPLPAKCPPPECSRTPSFCPTRVFLTTKICVLGFNQKKFRIFLWLLTIYNFSFIIFSLC